MVQSLKLALEPPSSNPSTKDVAALQPLSQRLHRLWTERGDFSKFSLKDLRDEEDDDQAEATGEQDATNGVGGAIKIGWAHGEEDRDKGAASKVDDEHDAQAADKDAGSLLDTRPMSMEDFVQLKEEMMGRLQIAQQSLYSSQALVSLLVAGHRSRASLLQQGHLDPAKAATSSNAASRAPSPGAVSSTASESGKATPAKGQPGQASQQPQGPPPGSAAAVEAEFGLEPASVALTAIERIEVKEKQRSQAAPGDEDDEDFAERERQDPAGNLEFSNEAERDEYARKTQLVLAQKRQTMRSVVNILRTGARLLDDDDGRGDAGEASTSTSATSATRHHWSTLREAQARGWGITPGRPGRSQYQAQVQRADEGEQDAWIGFAVPEARTAYARRGLAYVARDAGEKEDKDSETEEKDVKKPEDSKPSASAPTSSAVKLTFSSRVAKRFKVSLVTLDTEGKVLSRSASTLPEDDAEDNEVQGSIDAQLRQAQRELVDRELFEDVAAEARLLASQGVVSCESSDDSVLVRLAGNAAASTSRLETGLKRHGTLAMRLEMVDFDASKEEGSEEGESAREPEPARSAYVSLMSTLMRLGLVRRYQERATAAASAARAEAEKEREKDKPRKPPGDAASSASNAGSKKAGAASSQPESSSTQKRARLDPWIHAPTLMPLVALLHYSSFLFHVRSVVQQALHSASSPAAGSKNEQDLKGELEMHPAQSIANAAVWMKDLLYAPTAAGQAGQAVSGEGPGEPAAARAIRSLRGSATVTVEVPAEPQLGDGEGASASATRKIVLAHLTLSYPSHLSVQLPWRSTLSGSLGVTMHGVEVHGKGERALHGLLVEELRGVRRRSVTGG
ncbi:hypothetical protein BDZ90DRAFT_231090 [Jaminaea rosea]|uniref:Mediator of RNA polymerase II transcription subunit 17 n=1 Tax=Jaminaea rosea TaxID=1569628 RepID=A0A316UUV3_9BASI|nr:hypothetical protein BDZ90DRAFT_231090 [Jaminaea rosea]PWN29090.1 hypothetical protein BDZ90DRAFT_231090 [Jaminaea rosea]